MTFQGVGGEMEQKSCLSAGVMEAALGEIAPDQRIPVGGSQLFQIN